MNLRLLISALALTAALPSLRAATGADPLEAVRDGVDRVCHQIYDLKDAPEPLSARLRPVLEKDFDFDAITRRSVGPAWRQFTPDERAKTKALFSELILRSYADRFEPQERPEISYGKIVSLAENRVEVPTTITYRGNNYAVAYRVLKKDEAWLVYDVIIEGVSMISNFRAQFEELLKKGGASDVIRALEDNLAKATKPTAS